MNEFAKATHIAQAAALSLDHANFARTLRMESVSNGAVNVLKSAIIFFPA